MMAETSSGRPTDGARTSAECRTQTETETETKYGTRSRSDAQTRGRADEQTLTSRIRSTPQAVALARIVADLRPDWAPADIHAWALGDDRPWAVVVRAAIAGAADPGIHRVAGLRHVNPDTGRSLPTPVPPSLAEISTADRCPNGAVHDPHPCALCRAGRTPEDAA